MIPKTLNLGSGKDWKDSYFNADILLRVNPDWWVDISKESDFGMLIAFKGRIFEHNAVDMSLTEYNEDYLAMGSGSDFALGSLWTTQHQKNGKRRAQLAVEAAVKYSTSCIGPVDVVSI